MIKKKLTAMIVGVGIVYANKKFLLGIDEMMMKQIVAMIVAYIAGQAIADIGKEKAKVAGHISQDIAQ